MRDLWAAPELVVRLSALAVAPACDCRLRAASLVFGRGEEGREATVW
jgi:hypothetical protein